MPEGSGPEELRGLPLIEGEEASVGLPTRMSQVRRWGS